MPQYSIKRWHSFSKDPWFIDTYITTVYHLVRYVYCLDSSLVCGRQFIATQAHNWLVVLNSKRWHIGVSAGTVLSRAALVPFSHLMVPTKDPRVGTAQHGTIAL